MTAHTLVPKTRVRRRRTVVLVAATVLVLVAGAALASVTVEPLRGHLWAAVGPSCGTLETLNGARPPHVVGAPDEQCLLRAARRCQAATLTYDQRGLDSDYTIYVVIEPAVPYVASCTIATLWYGGGEVGGSRSGVEHCTSVALLSDGLHVNGCGALGDIVVPAH
jgi:hypothetical protein